MNNGVENTKPKQQTGHQLSGYFVLAFALLIAAAIVAGINLPLLGPDEPRYAQVAREMYLSGDWITPRLGGHTWFEKPALLYWVEALSFTLFGVSEWTVRIAPALFGAGTIASVWLLVKKLCGENAGRWALVVAGSTLGIVAFSHGASFDITLTMPMTAALAFYANYEIGSKKSLTSLAGFWIFVGIALIAKGLVGAVFPGAIVFFYHLVRWRMPSKAAWMSLAWGTVVMVAVAGIWYVPVYLANGWPFIEEFFVQHHFQRYTSNKYQHPQPFFFFLWVLPLLTLPWLPFVLSGAWQTLKPRPELKGDAVRELSIFALVWVLVPLIFFSFSGSKLPGYILPSVPACSILAALSFASFASRSPLRIKAGMLTGIATTIAMTAVLVFYMPGFAAGDSVKGLIDTANAQGYSSSKVVGFYTISHNAEFYAPGRLVRDGDGQQHRFTSLEELESFVRAQKEPVLVFTQLHVAKHVFEDPKLLSHDLGHNGELQLIAVQPSTGLGTP